MASHGHFGIKTPVWSKQPQVEYSYMIGSDSIFLCYMQSVQHLQTKCSRNPAANRFCVPGEQACSWSGVQLCHLPETGHCLAQTATGRVSSISRPSVQGIPSHPHPSQDFISVRPVWSYLTSYPSCMTY